MPTCRRPRLVSALAVLAAAALASCSGGNGAPGPDGRSAGGPEATATAGATAAASDPSAAGAASGPVSYPLTLEQGAGEVTIPERPERVAVVDEWALDIVVELGVEPVVALTYRSVHPWVAGAPELADTEVVTMGGDGLPLEVVAASRPDVVIDGYGDVADTEAGDRLREIAPLVGPPEDWLSDGWRERVRHIGTALGLTDEAEALIAEGEATLAEIRVDHPEFEGAALNFARFPGPDTFDIVADESDFTRHFLSSDFGFATPEPVAEAFAAGGLETSGGVLTNVSLERLDLLSDGADVALVLVAPDAAAELTSKPVWQELPIVSQERVVLTDPDGLAAFRTPTPGAIAWAADGVVADLGEALASG